jgi:hypothetical protein
MKRRVVDTNVAIVANGSDTNASPSCQLATLEALRAILKDGKIVVDAAGEMLAEYRRLLSPSGQPGVGDRFFYEVLMNYGEKVERIELEKRPDGSFVDFPDDQRLATFDQDDRKFAVASRKGGVPVMNATDTDWLDHREALVENGIVIEFLCGLNSEAWFVG